MNGLKIQCSELSGEILLFSKQLVTKNDTFKLILNKTMRAVNNDEKPHKRQHATSPRRESLRGGCHAFSQTTIYGFCVCGHQNINLRSKKLSCGINGRGISICAAADPVFATPKS